MIISISGISASGKTSLCKLLQERGYPVITPSASRLASGHKFPSMEAKDRFIFETAHQQLVDAQRISEATGKPVFLDRSNFDNWTFRFIFGGDLSYEQAFIEDIDALDYIWILDPTGVPFVADGVRPEDMRKRDEWHGLMLYKADEFALPHDILSGTPQERLEKVLRALPLELQVDSAEERLKEALGQL